MPFKRLNTVQSSLKTRQNTVAFSKNLNAVGLDFGNRLDADELYKLSKEITQSECPTIGIGLNSYHYWLIISIVTTSMSYDYFLNAVWKSYGGARIEGITDQSITTVMIIASLTNAFVRIFVGKLLASVSYKKFYLCL